MDRSLIMEIKKGDKQALSTLVERHNKMAFQVALGLVGTVMMLMTSHRRLSCVSIGRPKLLMN